MVKLHWVYSFLASQQLRCCGVLRSNRLCSPIYQHKRYFYPGIPLQSILKYLFIDRIFLSYFVHHSFRVSHQPLSDRCIIRGPLEGGLRCTLVVHSLIMLKAYLPGLSVLFGRINHSFFVFSFFILPPYSTRMCLCICILFGFLSLPSKTGLLRLYEIYVIYYFLTHFE